MADKDVLNTEMIQNMILMLETVRERPKMWVGGIDARSLSSFMAGYEFALLNLGIEINREMQKRELEAQGVHLSSGGIIGYLKAQGMTDAEITDEVLRYEIEAWKKRRDALLD